MYEKYKAYLFLSIAQFSVAVNVVCGKILVEALPTMSYVAARFLFGVFFLSIIMLISRSGIYSDSQKEPMNKGDFQNIFLQALTAGFLFNLFFYWGLDYTTATSAGIISSCLPGIIAIMAVFLLKEKLNKQKIVALILSMLGILCLSMDNSLASDTPRGSWLGDGLIFLSLIPEAIYSILNKRSSHKINTLATALIVNLIAFIMVTPLAYSEISRINFDLFFTVQVMAYLAITGACSAMFFWFWPQGLKTVEASDAAIFGGILPIACSLLAVTMLNESFKINEGMGLTMVLLSIYTSGSKKVANILS